MKELAPIENFFTRQGWTPFPFQRDAWKAILEGDSGLIHVPTGSGKTYAAVMPLFADFLANPRPGLKALYITPLRALARDIELGIKAPIELEEWPLRVESRTGDTSYNIKVKQLRSPADLMLTTPESLSLIISQPEGERVLSKVEYVILDEWHELLSSKRGSLLELSLSYLRTLNPDLRVWALSASLGNLKEAAQVAVGRNCTPRIITHGDERQLDAECLLPDRVDRFPWSGHLGLSLKEKLKANLDPDTSTLIFTNTRMQAEKWFQTLT